MNEKELRALQKEANRYIRLANKAVKEGTASAYIERAYMKAENRLRIFQKRHNQRKGYLFSMKNLTADDYDTYENILKSITESTRLNPEKAEKFKESQIQFYQDKGWASNEKSAEALFDFKQTSAFETLTDKKLSDIPSKVLEKYGQFIDANYGVEDFSNLITVFDIDLRNNNTYEDYEDFIRYADKYIDAMREREDFKKAVDSYLDYGFTQYSSFFNFLEDF